MFQFSLFKFETAETESNNYLESLYYKGSFTCRNKNYYNIN